jgi:hypothetical protein
MELLFKGEKVRNLCQDEMVGLRRNFTSMLLSLPILTKSVVATSDFEGKEFISVE